MQRPIFLRQNSLSTQLPRVTMIPPFATSFIAVLALGKTALAAPFTLPKVVININIVATISGEANAALVPLSSSSSPTQVRNIGEVGYLYGMNCCDHFVDLSSHSFHCCRALQTPSSQSSRRSRRTSRRCQSCLLSPITCCCNLVQRMLY